jgi:hypothetical protein
VKLRGAKGIEGMGIEGIGVGEMCVDHEGGRVGSGSCQPWLPGPQSSEGRQRGSVWQTINLADCRGSKQKRAVSRERRR